MLGTIIWALIAGTVLGYLAKLILPGKQDIPAWATVGAGIVGALLAGLVASWLGVRHTAGVNWILHGLQVLFAVIAVYLVARLYTDRRSSRGGRTHY